MFWQLYPTGRDDTMALAEQVAFVDAKAADLVALGAEVIGGERSEDPEDPYCFVTLRDPEGNVFCLG